MPDYIETITAKYFPLLAFNDLSVLLVHVENSSGHNRE